jgi:4a-hydroxytetrahydrobiopterin dehydratase
MKPLTVKEVRESLEQLPGWVLSKSGDSITKEYRMEDFVAAVKFIGKIAKLAEKEGHHPDLHLTSYRKLKIELSTHAIGGLSENDFILATKIDRLPL